MNMYTNACVVHAHLYMHAPAKEKGGYSEYPLVIERESRLYRRAGVLVYKPEMEPLAKRRTYQASKPLTGWEDCLVQPTRQRGPSNHLKSCQHVSALFVIMPLITYCMEI